MQDNRARSSLRNLASYRAWEHEGLKRSGFLIFTVLAPSLGSLLTASFIVFRQKLPLIGVEIAGGVVAAFLLATVCLMAFAVLRLAAWKRAHPWLPPESVFLKSPSALPPRL